ncbi:MAG: hypothetical protein RLZZ258_1214 [Actinomycetota bacterium]|jgi:polar amino acid transport system permease protein
MNNKVPSTVSGAIDIVSGGLLPSKIVRLRHPGRVFSAIIIGMMAILGAISIVTNPNFEWEIVFKYLFHPAILNGIFTTVWLTVVCMIIAIILGIVLASFRMSANVVLKSVSAAYLWFFRGTPLLVQLIFLYNLGALYPTLGIGIPFTDISFFEAATNDIMTVWLVAIAGLALHESAYMAEIVRSGLLSVSTHQSEAAHALGLDNWQTFRRIILPQALRVIIPPTGNQFIGMLKYSSLVSVIAVGELLYSAQLIYSQTFETIPVLITASLWYLFCTTILTIIQSRIEKYFAKGVRGATPVPKSSSSLIKKLIGRGA